jgi:hypothetical protein
MMAAQGFRGAVGSFVFLNLRLMNDQTLENATGVGAPPWTWPADEQVLDPVHRRYLCFRDRHRRRSPHCRAGRCSRTCSPVGGTVIDRLWVSLEAGKHRRSVSRSCRARLEPALSSNPYVVITT